MGAGARGDRGARQARRGPDPSLDDQEIFLNCRQHPEHRFCTVSFKNSPLHSSSSITYTLPCMKNLKKNVKTLQKKTLISLLLILTPAFYDHISVMTDISWQPSI